MSVSRRQDLSDWFAQGADALGTSAASRVAICSRLAKDAAWAERELFSSHTAAPVALRKYKER